jgi:hypothetical protein
MHALSLSRVIVCLLALLLVTGPATDARAIDLIPDFFGGKDSADDGKTLWKAGHQYVKVVPREKDSTPNQHPVTLSVAELATALGALQYNSEPGLLSRGDASPLFVASEVNDLANVLARAMPELGPDEDLAFVVIGLHRSTFARERMGVSGRIFYAGDRLNIVLGEVHKPLRVAANKRIATTGEMTDDIDLRVDPFKIGRRAKSRSLKHRITGPKGLDFATTDRGTPREDWLRLDLGTLSAEVLREENKLPAGLEEERVRMQREAQKMAIERRQMREEMARMRKDMQGGPAGSTAAGGSVEARLEQLEGLREKGLVSEQEYARKRDEILGEL